MRTWRVGTVSMGLALILLGVILMVSQFTGWELVNLASAWWPMVLIVLGVEVIVYLVLSKQEKPVIKYDFVSILFIGALGTVGILFFIVSSIGLIEEVQGAMKSESIQGSLPTIEENLTNDINKIVVQPGHEELTIETNSERTVHLFGTFESSYPEAASMKKEDLVNLTKTGDTLFIQLLDGPRQHGIHYKTTSYQRTLSLPHDIDVEIRGKHRALNINIEKLKADWMIDEASQVTLGLKDSSDVAVKLESFREDLGWDVNWDKEETIKNGERQLFYKEKQFGEGSYTLQFNILNNFTIKQVGPRS